MSSRFTRKEKPLSNTDEQQTEEPIRDIQVQWIEADSSHIKRYGWAPNFELARRLGETHDGTLVIEFKSGATYQYFEVPREVFEEMQGAESQGVFLARQIKGRYEYGKV